MHINHSVFDSKDTVEKRSVFTTPITVINNKRRVILSFSGTNMQAFSMVKPGNDIASQ